MRVGAARIDDPGEVTNRVKRVFRGLAQGVHAIGKPPGRVIRVGKEIGAIGILLRGNPPINIISPPRYLPLAIGEVRQRSAGIVSKTVGADSWIDLVRFAAKRVVSVI